MDGARDTLWLFQAPEAIKHESSTTCFITYRTLFDPTKGVWIATSLDLFTFNYQIDIYVY
jgi:hypothetical protein